jgi:hypothetical protein
MAWPWEKYQPPPDAAPSSAPGPWAKYQGGPSFLDQAAGYAEAAGTGLERGALAVVGMPGDIGAGVDWAMNKLTGATPEQQAQAAQYDTLRPPTSQQLTNTAQAAGVPFHQPQNTGERYAETISSFIPGSLIGPGGLASKIGSAVAGGAASEKAGEMTQGTALEPYARFGGAVLGGGLSLAMQPAWRGVAATLANRGTDAKSIDVILKQLDASGMSPQQAEQRLRELGPEGMLGDVSSGMQLSTGATAISDIGAGNTIAQRLAQRREGGQGRVSQDLNSAFGPPQDPFLVRQSNQTAKTALGPAYDAARGRSVVVTPIVKQINDIAKNFPQTGSAADALRSVRSMLNDQQARGLIKSANNLLGVRHEIDHLITQAGGGNYAAGLKTPAGAALAPVRNKLNLVLHQNSSLAAADQDFAKISREQSAFDQGRTDVLRGGPNTMTPEQLRSIQTNSSNPENAMRQQGVRTELDRLTSNQRQNPATTVDRVGTRDWNDQKLAIMLGQQKSDEMRRALDREATFEETSRLGEPGRGSRTAPLLETAKQMFGTEKKPLLGEVMSGTAAGGIAGGPLGALAGGTTVVANRVRQKIADALSGTSSPKTIQATADRLTATGARQTDIISELNAAKQQLGKSASVSKLELLARALLLGNWSRAQGLGKTP